MHAVSPGPAEQTPAADDFDAGEPFEDSGLDGIAVPRTAAEQFAGGHRVSEADLHAGDLVFFGIKPGSRAVTHVGIYTGERRFVHAPQTGRNVGVSSLDDEYYRARFAGSGRYYEIPDSRPHRASAPR